MSTSTSPANAAYMTSVASSLPTVAPQPLATSAVSWGAVLAGALAAAALSLILLILGAGLGLSTFSPWTGVGASAATFGVSAIVWVAVTQLAASGLGGYLAGRFRTRWTDLQRDEVFFRDTVHGFLAWAVATVATAAVLTGTIGAVLGQAPRAATPSMEGAAMAQGPGRAVDVYYVDMLLRGNGAGAPVIAAAATPMAHAEAARIMAHGLREGALPDEDVRYLSLLVTQRTGLAPAEAQRRVLSTFERARQTAGSVAKAGAHASLWMFIALLAGAFVASWLGTVGGRQRDR